MLCALIMAGGKGTRFWPLSTEEKPKQFLNLVGNNTMIQMTVDRIIPIIPIERIFICTGERYVDLVKEQLPNLPERNIIIEPEGRNTAPCIELSALVIKRYYENAKMVVLPSDHLIKYEDKFRDIILTGAEFLKDYPTSIVTLWMLPDRPETGYGYIETGRREVSSDKFAISSVRSFVEKPNKEKAEEYLKTGNFLWNGGMFIWTLDGILDKIKMYMPRNYELLKDIASIEEEELTSYIYNKYHDMESISIDYGILEKSDDIHVIPSSIGWDDVGSWEALDRYREKDSEGNIVIGESEKINAKNNIIVSNGKKIIIENLEDIYVLEGEDIIIVGRKGNINKLKNLKESVGL